jgi:hypothetical protein
MSDIQSGDLNSFIPRLFSTTPSPHYEQLKISTNLQLFVDIFVTILGRFDDRATVSVETAAISYRNGGNIHDQHQ